MEASASVRFQITTQESGAGIEPLKGLELRRLVVGATFYDRAKSHEQVGVIDLSTALVQAFDKGFAEDASLVQSLKRGLFAFACRQQNVTTGRRVEGFAAFKEFLVVSIDVAFQRPFDFDSV